MKRVLIAVATAAITAASAAPAAADTVYGVTASDQLVSFSSDAPGVVSSPVAITGLASGESVAGIDFRPATLQLYALGSTGQLYRVDTSTGAATAVGTALALTGSDFDIDFNPAVDRLRIISDADQNLRVNPNNAAVTVDGPLAFAVGDPNAGDNPVATAAAYANSRPASAALPNPPSTTLYDIDAGNDVLVTQAPPNNGTLNTVGALGVDVQSVAGFDIVSATGNTAYALLKREPAAGEAVRSRLYTIDLATGAAAVVGALPAADQVKDVAVAPAVPTFVALTSGTPQGLSTFRADAPGAASPPVPVSGLQVGERLVGLDTRPATGQLYGIGSSSRVYLVDPSTGQATAVGNPLTTALSGAAFGVDFNPVPDRIRVTSDAEQNLRVNPADGVTIQDTALAYAGGDPNAGQTPDVTGSGYANSVASADATTLYDVDSALNVLARQDPPNNGVLNTVGPLGVDITATNGFDVVPRFNHEFGAFQVAGEAISKLFAVNAAGSPGPPITPANGAAVLVGQIGLPAGTLAEGLATLNGDRIALGSASAVVSEGAVATVSVVRTSGSETAATVKVGTANGSATAPADYAATAATVRFEPGETTKTVPVATAADAAFEGDEAFTVTLSEPTGGAAIGAPASASIVIVDDDPAPQPTVTPTATPTYTLPVAVSMAARVRPKRDRRRPFRFRTTGTLTPSNGLPDSACTPGRVNVRVKVKGRARTLSSRTVNVKSDCTFSSRVTFRNTKRFGRRKGTLRFRIRFQGNASLRARTANRTARFG